MEQTKTRIPPALLTVIVASFATILVLIWGILLLHTVPEEAPSPGITDPVQTTQPRPTQTQPTETIPPETTAADVVAAFAQEHGYTLADYPEKLIALLERSPEAERFVLDYPLEYGKDHPIDISSHADDEGVPLFIQWDKQWGYKDYVGNIAGLSGCGPTCLSMVVYHFTRDPQMHPAYMMDFAESDPKYVNSTVATQWALFSQGSKEFGLTPTELTGEQIASEEKLAQILSSGQLIIANVGPGVFTEIGHYLLITGYADGKFQINDPNSPSNSARGWAFSEFSDQIKMMWSFRYSGN